MRFICLIADLDRVLDQISIKSACEGLHSSFDICLKMEWSSIVTTQKSSKNLACWLGVRNIPSCSVETRQYSVSTNLRTIYRTLILLGLSLRVFREDTMIEGEG